MAAKTLQYNLNRAGCVGAFVVLFWSKTNRMFLIIRQTGTLLRFSGANYLIYSIDSNSWGALDIEIWRARAPVPHGVDATESTYITYKVPRSS